MLEGSLPDIRTMARLPLHAQQGFAAAVGHGEKLLAFTTTSPHEEGAVIIQTYQRTPRRRFHPLPLDVAPPPRCAADLRPEVNTDARFANLQAPIITENQPRASAKITGHTLDPEQWMAGVHSRRPFSVFSLRLVTWLAIELTLELAPTVAGEVSARRSYICMGNGIGRNGRGRFCREGSGLRGDGPGPRRVGCEEKKIVRVSGPRVNGVQGG